ncbi:MAG TPA: hypothetical protein VK466_03840 [Terriglobales bacterium]|nr:hypothetical protein [Terriglobales bacterium]
MQNNAFKQSLERLLICQTVVDVVLRELRIQRLKDKDRQALIRKSADAIANPSANRLRRKTERAQA